MSMRTYINYGYGFCVEELVVESPERIEKLISLAPDYQKKVHGSLKANGITEPTVDDYLEFTDDCENGFADFLAEVMMEATGLWFCSCCDYDGDSYVLYMPDYPWNMTEKDNGVTAEYIKKLMKEYVAIISDTSIDVDYQEVENCG